MGSLNFLVALIVVVLLIATFYFWFRMYLLAAVGTALLLCIVGFIVADFQGCSIDEDLMTITAYLFGLVILAWLVVTWVSDRRPRYQTADESAL